MTIVEPIAAVKANLSRYVASAMAEHERTVITVNGREAAVLINAEDLEILEETLYWTTQPDWAETLRAADRDFATGDAASMDDVRADLAARKAAGEL